MDERPPPLPLADVEAAQQNFARQKERMRELARAYAARHPPTDTLSLAAGLDARLEYTDLGERDGAYDPEHGLILINKKHGAARQRFTLAHEVSHALLLRDDDLLSALHDTFEGDKLENAIETLCNVGAATILIPDTLRRDLIERFGATGRALSELARRADVSASTAMIALTEVLNVPVIFAVAVSAKNLLTVRASSATPAAKYSLGTGTVIPEGHPVEVALATGLPMEEYSYVPFKSGRKLPALVNAYPERFRVLASFQTEGERNPLS